MSEVTIPEPERLGREDLDAGDWLEALHATYLVAAMFEDHVLDPPAVARSSALAEQGRSVLAAILALRQAIEDAAP